MFIKTVFGYFVDIQIVVTFFDQLFSSYLQSKDKLCTNHN